MNDSTSPKPNQVDLLRLAKRYGVWLAALAVSGAVIGFLTAELLPKKYKSRGTLTIYSKYFQNPMLRDLVPEVTDSSELRAQRESMIRAAITPEFLIKISQTHSIAPETLLDPRAIDVFSINTTTFQIGVVNRDARSAYLAAKQLNEHIIESLMNERRENMRRVRDSIRKRLESIAFNMGSTSDPRAAGRPTFVKEELEGVRAQIRAFISQYTEQHPVVVELRERERLLSRWLERGGKDEPATAEQKADASASAAATSAGTKGAGAPPLVGGEPETAVATVYRDLMSKMNLLNIAIETESERKSEYLALIETPSLPLSPLWPNRMLFLGWGAGIGMLIGLMLMSLREYILSAKVTADVLAERLGVRVLGRVPSLKAEEAKAKGRTSDPEKSVWN